MQRTLFNGPTNEDFKKRLFSNDRRNGVFKKIFFKDQEDGRFLRRLFQGLTNGIFPRTYKCGFFKEDIFLRTNTRRFKKKRLSKGPINEDFLKNTLFQGSNNCRYLRRLFLRTKQSGFKKN